ncbi:MAG: tripartite tricarboxylate transporter substrate binding protein [Burkholderiaceae bacterium]|nr:tripartite tricarboxylate transporter substrate binding protein [Burkholderiaceae bacterium]
MALIAGGAALPAGAQSAYPSKPIHWIVPYPPGGATDTQSRLLADRLSKALGQRVVVENKAGGAGAIGSQAVARAAPDGYTLVYGTSQSHSTNAVLVKSLGYDPVKDFKPVILVAKTPNVIAVHPSVPARNLDELLNLLKARPGTPYAVSGAGSSAHFAGALLAVSANVKTTVVPYKGGGQAVADMIGGVTSLGIADIMAVLPYSKSGQLRAIAVTSASRSPAAPDVPTVAESGVKGYEAVAWQGLFAPAGTPDAIVRRLNAEVARILQQADVRERLVGQGAELAAGSPEDFEAFVREDIRKWRDIAARANVSLD